MFVLHIASGLYLVALTPAMDSADGRLGGQEWRPSLRACSPALPTALAGAGVHSRAAQALRKGRQLFLVLGQVQQQNSLL